MWDKTPQQGTKRPRCLSPWVSSLARSPHAEDATLGLKRDRLKDFDQAGLRPDAYEEILVYRLLKQRLKSPQVHFRVRLNEQEKALGVRQRVGTTIVK